MAQERHCTCVVKVPMDIDDCVDVAGHMGVVGIPIRDHLRADMVVCLLHRNCLSHLHCQLRACQADNEFVVCVDIDCRGVDNCVEFAIRSVLAVDATVLRQDWRDLDAWRVGDLAS